MPSSGERSVTGESARRTHRPAQAAAALRRDATNTATRVVVLNADKTSRLSELLASLGYQVVAKAENAEQAFTLTANHRPHAVILALDSLDRANALFAVRILNHRYTCAVIVLAEKLDRSMLTQLKLASPHAVIPLPASNEILDASLHFAIDAAAQRAEARRARLEAGAASGPVPAGFDTYFNLAVGRALRHGTTFAAGVVGFVADDPEATQPQDASAHAIERMRAQLRQHDIVRRRADGTLVFLAEDVGPNELEPLGDRILRALLTRPPPTPGARPLPWPAVGLALWSAPGHEHHGLLHAAEDAMANASKAGGACWRIALLDGTASAAPAQAPTPAREPEAPAAPSRRALVFVQRLIGWASLGVLLWVVANYLGYGSWMTLAH